MLQETLNQTKDVPTNTEGNLLSVDVITFLNQLHQRFNTRRIELLEARKQRLAELEAGKLFDFLPETLGVRNGDWKIAQLPADLKDRRVEITGPVDRKMVINGLNAGAKVFMADFEDSHSPRWDNVLEGHQNIIDAVNGTIAYHDELKNKTYTLADSVSTLMVRPRGWHLNENNFTVGGEITSASLFDFGLYFFHNSKTLISKGSGPYFYLPKLESHLEARLWNDVFVFAQEHLNIPIGTIKATVLIETLPAAFEMDEILFELKDHSAGLNCGRWDYIFSFIKKTKNLPGFVFPDRALVTMNQPCMEAYCKLLVYTCHKRGAHAMGGMAAQIPIKNDPVANKLAMDKVQQDKLREVNLGHDGTWVAHPALIPIAMEVFNQYMPTSNQINKLPIHPKTTAAQLLAVPAGTISTAGIINNLDVALQYTEAWLSGKGCVPIYNLMEDAATAEIARTQVWQWLKTPGTKTKDGQEITATLIENLYESAVKQVKHAVGTEQFNKGRFKEASALLRELVYDNELHDFLTIKAYQQL